METAGVNSTAEIKTISNTHTHTHTQFVDTGSALCLPLQVKLSQLCEQDKILKELEVKISSLKEDKVEPLAVGLNDSPLPPAGVCLASTDLPPPLPPPDHSPSTSTLHLQDKLESVLDLSRQQMEQYKEQPGHAHKIAHQQRLLQEDLVSIRAQISRRSKVPHSTLGPMAGTGKLFDLWATQGSKI